MKICKDKHRNICQLYTDGYGSNDIAKFYSVNGQTILNILYKNGIKTRSGNDPLYFDKRKIHVFDTTFFDFPSAELAYMMGFVLGDGNLSIDIKSGKYRVTITVHQKDICILQRFCDWIKCDYEAIKKSTRAKRLDLMLNDKIFENVNNFIDWGLVPNKTYNPCIPNVSDKLLAPFLIGLIDADGSISFNKKYSMDLVGNNEIMKWFINSIKKLGYSGKITHRTYRNKVWSRVCIYNKKDVMSLAKVLRINEYDFLLGRKWINVKNEIC